ncbi:nuclear pore complex protein nup98a-like [Anaeramoeba ignava]|uniref:Nuclear pore complex protein nup98a-like n=1 Tax=Anaeramoeba ignava TaxID=1746090 RepID=A0A9Q0L598_ANAIG|nr:nuclear pore complex protein nup98a-like [Anaeramoeba ignava]
MNQPITVKEGNIYANYYSICAKQGYGDFKEGNIYTNYYSICAKQGYEDFSYEEIRLDNNRNTNEDENSNQNTNITSLFGNLNLNSNQNSILNQNPITVKEGNIYANYYSICAKQGYEDRSYEEIRLENNRNTN